MIIRDDIGMNKEFNVYDIYSLWAKRWGRLPSIKELSKVLPSNPALDHYRTSTQTYMIYTWTGRDLFAYICETDEDLKKYKAMKKELEKKEED